MSVMGNQRRASIHPVRAQATAKAWLEFRLSWSFTNGLKQSAPQSGQSAEAGQAEVDRADADGHCVGLWYLLGPRPSL